MKTRVSEIVGIPLYQIGIKYNQFDIITRKQLLHLFVDLLFEVEDDPIPSGVEIGRKLVNELQSPPRVVKEIQENRRF